MIVRRREPDVAQLRWRHRVGGRPRNPRGPARRTRVPAVAAAEANRRRPIRRHPNASVKGSHSSVVRLPTGTQVAARATASSAPAASTPSADGDASSAAIPATPPAAITAA